ncbi:MAG: haloacid dehalogenase-like hydrolase [Bacteroidaceae bacterium]|nr:haloacid dehalogenase-like hydrolase [Bacteroidaceae bacterium]
MNVYDFDKTICYKDSTFGFWCFCLTKKPWIILFLPLQFLALLTRKMSWWWIYLRVMNVNESLIKEFADKHERHICDWYLQQKQPTDVIVSASPEFIIREMATRLGVDCVASQVDMETGRYYKPSCSGKQKVVQFRAKYPDTVIQSSYGNAESDQYIMNEGTHAYLVKNYSRTDANFQQWH